MKNYTIPFFIPHRGCGHKCVFCDQSAITGENPGELISSEDVARKIERYLATMPSSGVHVQAGFFGGSFTGIGAEQQRILLSPAKSFLDKGLLHGIRLSTRPDLIDEGKLDLLKEYGVTCVELGVQSMADDVLEAAGRGHTSEHTVKASQLILERGFMLTHQIMLGLPLSSYDKELYTARMSVELGAGEVRIYPVIVMKGTELAEMWRRKEYVPLEMDDAVERAAKLICFFRGEGVKVIRCGLHSSEGLLSGEEYLAGPFHPSFGDLAKQLAEKMAH